MALSKNNQSSKISKTFDPKSFEKRIYKMWEEGGYFIADNKSDKKPFVISLPPPNATGQLHTGHAVMLAIEDILIRHHRMLGDEVLWVPGTDHAAIATESVVLNKLKEELKIKDPRKELGREKVIEKIKEYVSLSQDNIRNQIRAMGASVDWSRERYTMDEQLHLCVNRVFMKMYNDGLIYRGHRIVNWDPTLQTTISDDEIVYREEKALLYYIKYGPFVVSTSRPETKLGDTAVAVNPNDERYKKYVGQTIDITWPKGQVIHVKVIADAHVDIEFGSGVLGVTPAHSQADYEMLLDHELDLIQVINEDGKMMDTAGSYAGLTVLDCRKAFVEDLKNFGLIEKEEPYIQQLSICYRSKKPIEPLPKEQWFIDVNKQNVEYKGGTYSLKEILIKVVKEKEINIVPDRFDKTYFHWVENLRDWCISRQIWWGHRIPVWYKDGQVKLSDEQPLEGWSQDPDTLDTWFSSALWTWSTLIDPEIAKNGNLSFEDLLKNSPDFQKFHPNQVMETGYDILFFWVARMILMTTYMIEEVPFETVYLHGMVRTKEGKKMSKSDPSTCIDPLDSIDEFGADALRISLIGGTAPGMDLKIYREKIQTTQKFINKIWNAGRYIQLTLGDNISIQTPKSVNDEVNYWVLTRLNNVITSADKSLKKFRLSDVLENLRNFFWGDFCDWYLEISKKETRLVEDDQVLCYVYSTVLKLLHPFIPFVTEALFETLDNKNKLINAQWPTVQPALSKQIAHDNIETVKKLISNIRGLREKANIGVSQKISASAETLQYSDLFETHKKTIIRLARLSELNIINCEPKIKSGELSAYFNNTLVTIESGDVDWTAQIVSLTKKIEKEELFINKSTKKLSNQRFVNNAPQKVVDELKSKVEQTNTTIRSYQSQIDALSTKINS